MKNIDRAELLLLIRKRLCLGYVARAQDDLKVFLCEPFGGREARSKTEGVNAWIDPEGYRLHRRQEARAFEDEVDLEVGAAPPKPH